MFTKLCRRAITLISTTFLLAGCVASATSLTPHIESSATITPITEIEPTPAELPTGPNVEWDLVVIGDSSMRQLANAYAFQIEKDVGVMVIPHDVTPGGLTASKVLRSLQIGDTLTELPDTLREAEVVVMFVNPLESIDHKNPLDMAACFFAFKAPGSCSMDTFEKYIADLQAIWAEIFILRDGHPTILRATDVYNPHVTKWQESGVFETCTECWVNMSAANRIAAQAYDIPFLSRLKAFNGPDFTENPSKKGYIADDGEHPSELMGQYTAELLSRMGYDPVIPP